MRAMLRRCFGLTKAIAWRDDEKIFGKAEILSSFLQNCYYHFVIYKPL